MPHASSALVWSRRSVVADAVALAVDALSHFDVRAYRGPCDAEPPPSVLISCGEPPAEIPKAPLVIRLPDDGTGTAVMTTGGTDVMVEITGPDDIASLLVRYMRSGSQT